MVQERHYCLGVQVGPVQRSRSFAGPVLDEHDEHAQRVAVGRDGAWAGLSLLGEAVGEERLQCRGERGHDGSWAHPRR
jgi:hypothetical protein